MRNALRLASLAALAIRYVTSAALPFCVLECPNSAKAQPTAILLWPNGAPGTDGLNGAETVRVTPEGDHVISGIRQPSITPYLPASNSATGVAVVIAPGGGHSELWIDHEGYAVADWLSRHGVAAFV